MFTSTQSPVSKHILAIKQVKTVVTEARYQAVQHMLAQDGAHCWTLLQGRVKLPDRKSETLQLS